MSRECSASWPTLRAFCSCGKWAGDLREVADHRAGRGIAARAAPIIKRVADHIAAHQHRVEHAADRREHVRLRDERRMHAHLHRAVGIGLDDREQLQAVAELARVNDVLLLHRAQALGVKLVRRNPEAVGQRGQHGRLVRGVVAVDVEAVVGLGEAQRAWPRPARP